MTDDSRRTRWLARGQSLLGVALLGGFLLIHLWRLQPALEGREHWVAAAAERSLHAGLLLWVLVLLLAHGGLGVLRIARAGKTEPERGLRYVQAVSGALSGAFILYHVVQLSGLDTEPYGSVRAIYDELWRTLGHPLPFTLYLAGISVTCFHFAHGLSRAAVTFDLVRHPQAKLVARVIAGAVGFGLWALWLQLFAVFAIGGPLW